MSLFSYRSRQECELDSELDQFFTSFFGGRRFGDYWTPNIDMSDNGKELTVHAELPGVRKEDISLDVQGNALIISGESPLKKELSQSNTYFCERRFGNFKRNIPLPNDVDTSKINAAYKDGILEVKIEKKEDNSPKKISIV